MGTCGVIAKALLFLVIGVMLPVPSQEAFAEDTSGVSRCRGKKPPSADALGGSMGCCGCYSTPRSRGKSY